MNKPKFHPVISSIQKVALYETKLRLYLVGSNNQETKFRVLEIDRTSPDLVIYENPNEIRDIRKFLGSINYYKAISAYGILGWIKFLEGYYLVLITKRTRRALVGMHIIYTIEDTVMIRVNHLQNKTSHPFEQRYLKLFSNIDLSSNFYFSYSYDITRSLQYNMSNPKYVGNNVDFEKDEVLDFESKNQNHSDRIDYAFRGVSRKRFVWNDFLLRPMRHILNQDWMLEVTHGFISQSNISIFGRPIYVCLIARRSTRFAGTRFLKRGANCMGDVANEVETEQIVMDGNRVCSFVQMRGSVPSHWSQDISKMVPKPPISLDLSDPFCETSGKHYERLLHHYGSPIIVLNLVKKREKRKHESLLSDEMLSSIKYLNQFLSPQFKIKYVHFDMARKSRGGSNVMNSLAEIAENVIQQTGIFFSDNTNIQLQTGIVRVNCVDCLDRTNTAQFALGKSVLAHQLNQLGFINPPKLEFDSDCITMLESLYEDHGDTLALQYGGSQLVHRIKTYRKTAAWTSQGNDIMQTLSRYYSNTFSDTEKQHSINLFLGYFIPHEYLKQNLPLWEMNTDYYMHNLQLQSNDSKFTAPLTQWLNLSTLKHLPYSCANATKIVRELIRVHDDLDIIDSYSNYHLPYKVTSFEEHIAYQISHLARNFVPTFRTNFSPFEPGRRQERSLKNPSLTGQSSTSSTTSSTSSSMDEDSSSEDEKTSNSKSLNSSYTNADSQIFTLNYLLPTMAEVYGTKLEYPGKNCLIKYKKYVHVNNSAANIEQLSVGSTGHTLNRARPGKTSTTTSAASFFTTSLHNYGSSKIMSLKVPSESIEIYNKYCAMPNLINSENKSLKLIEDYVNMY